MDYQKMAAKIVAKAKEQGLHENLFFVATFSDYQKIRKHMAIIAKKADEQGVVNSEQVSPLVGEYNKCAQSAANLAEKLLKMLGESPKQTKDKKEDIGSTDAKQCPDFEMLPPAKIKAWCKRYDIDPNDYSKKFLFKALEKRWRFEFGE